MNERPNPVPAQALVIGGGAAGFFAAITCAEANSGAQVLLLEKGKAVLQKVKVSGGGRCNVTHACYDPAELVRHYPRGGKELLGPFYHFATADTVAWFERRGVPLKTEADGRMFPTTDSSQAIIDCLWQTAKEAGVKVLTRQNVTAISPPKKEGGTWQVKVQSGEAFLAKKIMVATGSSPRVWNMLKGLGHTVVPAVPSLFTFNIRDKRTHGLAGISVPAASVSILATAENAAEQHTFTASGPLLITHWGMSGPAVLKLSAWAARLLHKLSYDFEIEVNWLGGGKPKQVSGQLRAHAGAHAKKQMGSVSPFREIPKRLWEKFLAATEIDPTRHWSQLSKVKRLALATQLTSGKFQVKGKSTFKEEFVTAGGVDLAEMDMKNFASKLLPGLFIAGEALNIDAVTGGFNFQAAWTGGRLAGEAMAGG